MFNLLCCCSLTGIEHQTFNLSNAGSSPVSSAKQYHSSLIGIEPKTLNLVDAGSSPVCGTKEIVSKPSAIEILRQGSAVTGSKSGHKIFGHVADGDAADCLSALCGFESRRGRIESMVVRAFSGN